MKKNISLLFFLLFNIHNSFSLNILSNSLDTYICLNEEDAINCTKCEKFENYSIEFKININTSSIIQNDFKGSKFLGSTPLESCNVIDKNNWICGPEIVLNKHLYKKERKTMADGKFYSISIYHNKLSTLKGWNIFYCAK